MKEFIRKYHYIPQSFILQDNDNKVFRARKLAITRFCSDEFIQKLIPKIQSIKQLHVSVAFDEQTFQKLMDNSNFTSIQFNCNDFSKFEQLTFQYLNLTRLDFCYCNVDLINFSNFMSTTTMKLDTLKFYEKKFTQDLFESMGKYAKRTPTFTTLYLGSPDDDSDTKSNFGTLFKDLADSNLEKLLLQEFEIKSEYTKDFRKLIKRSHLTSLCLDMTVFSPSSLPLLHKMFKGSRLQKLEIKSYYLIDELAKSMTNIPFLIVSPSMPLLLDILNSSSNLQTFDIGDRYSATPEILSALRNCKTLRRCFFAVDTMHLLELCDFVQNCTLVELKIRGHQTIVDLTEALSINKTLNSIILSNFYEFGDLAKILQKNHQLINLNSSLTHFKDLNPIVESLYKNTSLCHLRIDNLNDECIRLLDRNRRIRTFPQERLWRLCYQMIPKEHHQIPQTIQDQWNEDHPDQVHSIIITEEEGNYCWNHEFNSRSLFID